jgi:hypothetical protein
MTLPGMKKYKFSEWMRAFRPDGLGRISVGAQQEDGTWATAYQSSFTEVICDFCNAEIPPKDEDEKESVLFASSSYAICAGCAKEG